VVICNRIKPHTDFAGDIESGLMKMMLIGLGNHAGAKIYHRAIQDFNFDQIVRSVAKQVLSRCPILAGIAVVENGYDQTARIAAVRSEEILEREKELLVLAKQLLPRLPFRQIDLLLVDRIGKNISGTGLDTNVVGRKFNEHEALENESDRGSKLDRSHERQRDRHRRGRVLHVAIGGPDRLAEDSAQLPDQWTRGRGHGAFRFSHGPVNDYRRAGHGRFGRTAAGPAGLDPRYAASRRGRVFGRLFG
jgi:hypothetical protein